MQRFPNVDGTCGTAKGIAQNSFFILLSRIVELGSGLAIIVLVANYFGVQDFGEFSFIRAVAFVLSPLVAFGTMRIIVREISVAKSRTAEIVTAGLTLNILMTAVAAVCAGGVPLLFNLKGPTGIASIYLALLAQSCLAMIGTVNAGFIAHEIAHFAALVNIVNRLLVIAAVIVVIWLHQDLLMLFVGIFCANLCGLAIALLLLRLTRIISDQKGILIANLKFLFQESYPIAMVVFMVQGYTYLNTFFLRFFHDNWHVAMFEASQRIILPLSMISTSILIAFVPMLSRLGKHAESHDRLLKVYAATLKFFFLTTLPVCAIVAVFAEPIILTIYNDDFSQAAKSLRILIWTIVPLFANGLLTFILTSLYKQKLLLISNASCFIVNAVLSWVLVKDFGFAGVSFAALIAYVILFGVNYHFVALHLGRVRLASLMIIPGLMTFLFYYAALSLMVGPLNRLLWMTLYIFLYFAVLLGSRIITGEELRRLFRPARKRPQVVDARP